MIHAHAPHRESLPFIKRDVAPVPEIFKGDKNGMKITWREEERGLTGSEGQIIESTVESRKLK